MFFGFEPIHMMIMVGGMVLSLAASGYVKYKFSQGQAVPLASGLTGADIARRILKHQGIDDVEVVEHEGFLSDHYDPTAKQLRLSPEVFGGQNAASAGVAAHEVGHALQHAQGDITMWGRTILVYPAHFGSMLAPLIIIAGIFLGSAKQAVSGHHALGYYLAMGGVFVFGVSTLCAVIIVFNEFNASARARLALTDMGITRFGEEDDTVKGVLTAAGLTYLAAAVISAVELVYWAIQAGLLGGGRRDD